MLAYEYDKFNWLATY